MYANAFLERFFDEVGYTRVILQSVGEPAITSLAKALVRSRSRESKDIMAQISLRQSPLGSHSSNGLAEVAVKGIEGLTRTFVHQIQKRCATVVKGNSAILGWIVRHAAFVYNRYMMKSNGRTAYEELKLCRYDYPVLKFGKNVLARR